MYNLITGVSSFFESYSARVIGNILSIPKNGHASLETIAGNTGIATESISEFAQVLKDNGLVTDRLFSRDEIAEINGAAEFSNTGFPSAPYTQRL